MNKLLFFLFLLLLGFAGGVGVSRSGSFHLNSIEKTALETSCPVKFQPTPYPLQHRSFAVVVVARNNGASLEKILTSIFSQNYENFRVVYIDDGSDDGSFELARDLICDTKYLIPTQFMQNEKPMGMASNVYEAVQNCLDEEIIVLVGENDWLAHEWVLQRLNQYYANPDLWITCAEGRKYPSFELAVRDFPLLTFHAPLLKKMKSADFSALLERGQGHIQSIPEILYITQAKNEI